MEHTYLGDGWGAGRGDGVRCLSVQAGGHGPRWQDARRGDEGVEASVVVDSMGMMSILTGIVLPLGEVVGLEGNTLRVPWVCAFPGWLWKLGGWWVGLGMGSGLCCRVGVVLSWVVEVVLVVH